MVNNFGVNVGNPSRSAAQPIQQPVEQQMQLARIQSQGPPPPVDSNEVSVDVSKQVEDILRLVDQGRPLMVVQETRSVSVGGAEQSVVSVQREVRILDYTDNDNNSRPSQQDNNPAAAAAAATMGNSNDAYYSDADADLSYQPQSQQQEQQYATAPPVTVDVRSASSDKKSSCNCCCFVKWTLLTIFCLPFIPFFICYYCYKGCCTDD